jgi:hypothetical protein
LTEKHFGKLPGASNEGPAQKFDPAIFTGSDKRISFDSMDVRILNFVGTGASH